MPPMFVLAALCAVHRTTEAIIAAPYVDLHFLLAGAALGGVFDAIFVKYLVQIKSFLGHPFCHVFVRSLMI